MRIFFLSTSMGMGGADSQLLSAARVLRARGHDVIIVSLTPLGPMGLQAREEGLRTESLEMHRGMPDPRGLLRLARLVRAWRPDVMHSHMVHANLMARALRVVAPVPALVSTIHNIYEGGPARMMAYRLTNRLVDHMTIVSQAAADRFVATASSHGRCSRSSPTAWTPSRFNPFRPAPASRCADRSASSRRSCGWRVGRFEVAKDYPNMLRAFARVRARHEDAVLLLVGKGSLQADTEALARELNLADSVRFVGVRNDVAAVMSAADGYVMSSAWEGMPMVLLEAAAAGLPIVATAVGGNHEVVLDDRSGFLVPPGDDAQLGSAMLRLAELPAAERRALGEQGREHVQAQYGLGRVADRWEAIYREVLARNGTATSIATSVGAVGSD